MATATRAELQNVPYLDPAALGNLDGRIVNLMPFWDGTRWHNWVPTPQGLFPMHTIDVFHSDYVAKTAAADTDALIPFVELMWQHLSWPDIASFTMAISADFHNLGTSIEKTDFFYLHQKEIGLAVTDFVKTELEYIFTLSRSVFDLIQEAIREIWFSKVRLNDEMADARRKQKALPKSFRSMVYRGKDGRPATVRTREDLINDDQLPPSLADAYIAAVPFFDQIRTFRDSVVHGLSDRRLLYCTERGFCLPKDFRDSYGLQVDIPDHFENENLVSLLPLLAHIVVGTIATCSNLMASFARHIVLAPPLAPGYRIFVRGPHNDALGWMLKVHNGGSPWWSERLRRPKAGIPSAPISPP